MKKINVERTVYLCGSTLFKPDYQNLVNFPIIDGSNPGKKKSVGNFTSIGC